ncbi:MAG: TonB-dependent receptor plug domain-containing protein, partial [Massilia sp.]
MRNSKTGPLRPNRVACAVSLALLSLAASNSALAQQSPVGAEADAAAAAVPTSTVLVVGTRLSQQSSIDRKKGAATAMDSIVAEDVGSLPDRNVGEAISRMAGIVLDRGDFGEGVTVAVRGNSADLTRVELDGQGVQSAGGTDQNGGGSGRGVEFRQLSADLIKSVDVVKGSTADMTEGALGGGIVIKTRTGLDFKKAFASLRLGGTQNSLDKKWTPDANLIVSNKFLDGRLGLMMNLSANTLNNEAHSMQVSQTAQQGYYRLLDFDNSPEKTYSFNPSTVNVGDSLATTAIVHAPLIAGGFFDSETPLSLVTKAGAIKSKDECKSTFRNLTQPELDLIVTASRPAVMAQRGNELATCLNQWNDYTPSNARYFVRKERDRKQNADLRADFKVNNQLTLYVKGSFNRRDTQIEQLTLQLGLVKNPQFLQSVTLPGYTGAVFTDNTTTLQRSAVPASGYYLYPNELSTRGNNTPIMGAVTNVDPASVSYDASHHLTRFTISDGQFLTDNTYETAQTSSQYGQ